MKRIDLVVAATVCGLFLLAQSTCVFAQLSSMSGFSSALSAAKGSSGGGSSSGGSSGGGTSYSGGSFSSSGSSFSGSTSGGGGISSFSAGKVSAYSSQIKSGSSYGSSLNTGATSLDRGQTSAASLLGSGYIQQGGDILSPAKAGLLYGTSSTNTDLGSSTATGTLSGQNVLVSGRATTVTTPDGALSKGDLLQAYKDKTVQASAYSVPSLEGYVSAYDAFGYPNPYNDKGSPFGPTIKYATEPYMIKLAEGHTVEEAYSAFNEGFAKFNTGMCGTEADAFDMTIQTMAAQGIIDVYNFDKVALNTMGDPTAPGAADGNFKLGLGQYQTQTAVDGRTIAPNQEIHPYQFFGEPDPNTSAPVFSADPNKFQEVQAGIKLNPYIDPGVIKAEFNKLMSESASMCGSSTAAMNTALDRLAAKGYISIMDHDEIAMIQSAAAEVNAAAAGAAAGSSSGAQNVDKIIDAVLKDDTGSTTNTNTNTPVEIVASTYFKDVVLPNPGPGVFQGTNYEVPYTEYKFTITPGISQAAFDAKFMQEYENRVSFCGSHYQAMMDTLDYMDTIGYIDVTQGRDPHVHHTVDRVPCPF